MPPNTVYVGRPTVFGNPFYVGMKLRWDKDGIPRVLVVLSRGFAVGLYRLMLEESSAISTPEMERWRKRIWWNMEVLRGRNLCCWCPIDQPCHADVLLELANSERIGVI